jgi:tetratricopeptide (TPR) repeat protein
VLQCDPDYREEEIKALKYFSSDFFALKRYFMLKKYPVVLFFLLLPFCFLWSQGTSNLSLNVIPGASIPVGESKDLYTIGTSISLNGEYFFPFSTIFFGKGMFRFNMLPTLAESNMNIVDFTIGAGICIPIISRLYFKLAGSGGYYIGMREGDVGSDPCISVDTEIKFLLNRSLSLGLAASYQNYMSINQSRPLYNGIGASLGLTYNIGAASKDSEIEFGPQLNPVFPVFYKYYDDHQIGSTTLLNKERGTISDVKVSLFVQEYMDQPKLCMEISEMERNEEIEVPLFALFTEDILKVTEGTKVTAEISVDYTYLGGTVTGKKVETLVINNRNAMTWDDDRKAAAFITSKDPAVLRFSKAVAADISNTGSGAVNSNFRMAMGIFEAISLFGIGYVVDPRTPYAEFSKSDFELDYLQFPIQTLTYRAGDCDDLSILYSALLESVGIETSFITVPGHIYMAFALDIEQKEAEKLFSSTNDLIFLNDNTWLPVEITLVKDGFLKAWQSGAREWRNYEKMETAAIYSIHEAWNTYEPVGMTEMDRGIVYPQSSMVMERYLKEMDKFVTREIHEKVVELRADIVKSGNNPRLINKLGVLYARFGMYKEAEVEFTKVVAGSDYLPAIMNLGNIHYLNGKMEEARDHYLRVLDHSPGNAYALLGFAKASFELDDYTSVVSTFEKIEKSDPEIAEKYSYLVSRSEDTSRASSAVKEAVEWDDE